MKKLRTSISIIYLSVSCITGLSQNRILKESFFRLSGSLKDRDTGIIVLSYPDKGNHWIKDTAYLKKGRFSFTGSLDEPTYCVLKGSGSDGNYINLFIEPSEQSLSLEENKFNAFSMTGSLTQHQADTLNSQTKYLYEEAQEFGKKIKIIRNTLKTTVDSAKIVELNNTISALNGQIANMNAEIASIKIRFIYSHPDSYASPTFLYGFLVSNQLETDSAETLFDRFTDRIKVARAANLIKEEFAKRQLGMEAPDISATDIKNNIISLSSLKGSCVLLNFWASWCAPCIEKLPDLKRLFVEYHLKKFEIINISVDKNSGDWAKSIEKYGLQVFYNILADDEIGKRYPNTRRPIPSEILIDRKGMVIWNSMNSSSKSLEQVLQENLKE